jgi:hypothetical protein
MEAGGTIVPNLDKFVTRHGVTSLNGFICRVVRKLYTDIRIAVLRGNEILGCVAQKEGVSTRRPGTSDRPSW